MAKLAAYPLGRSLMMPGIAERLLRVRDDGSGKARQRPTTINEFMSEDAIIVLGSPGMGKTTFFRAISYGEYCTVRTFLVDPRSFRGKKVLFLDALDEYRLVREQDAIDEVAKALCDLKKPRFRLSCRATDWFGSLDQEVLRMASASRRIVVLELCPLTDEEIQAAISDVVEDPAVFLVQSKAAGLEELLRNPQTLMFLAHSWKTGTGPCSRLSTYRAGISELLRESNEKHADRGSTSGDIRVLRSAAGAIATIVLLSNSLGIARTEAVAGDGFVGLCQGRCKIEPPRPLWN
jgi:hypothetical protein